MRLFISISKTVRKHLSEIPWTTYLARFFRDFFQNYLSYELRNFLFTFLAIQCTFLSLSFLGWFTLFAGSSLFGSLSSYYSTYHRYLLWERDDLDRRIQDLLRAKRYNPREVTLGGRTDDWNDRILENQLEAETYFDSAQKNQARSFKCNKYKSLFVLAANYSFAFSFVTAASLWFVKYSIKMLLA